MTMQPAEIIEVAESRQAELLAEQERITTRRAEMVKRLQELETADSRYRAAAIRQGTPKAKDQAAKHALIVTEARDELAGYDSALTEIADELRTIGAQLDEAREAEYQRQLVELREQSAAKALEFEQTLDSLLDIVYELQTLLTQLPDKRMAKEIYIQSPAHAAQKALERASQRVGIAHNPESITHWRNETQGQRPRMIYLLGLRSFKHDQERNQ